MVQRRVGNRGSDDAAPARRQDDGAYFAVEAEDLEHGLLVVARGELDAASAPKLAAVFLREGTPSRAVALDLSELTFIDSSGLRVVAAELQRYEAAGRTFTIRAASEPVRRILEMTGLSGLLDPTA